MKCLVFVVAFSFGAAFTAHAKSLQCNFESDYKFSRQGRTLIFSKDAAPGKRIMIQDGRVVIDGKELTLSSDDKARVTEFESEMRLLIPQVSQLTNQAIDIAFGALIEVSRALNDGHDNPAGTVKKLQNAQIALHNSMNKNPTLVINDDIDEKIIAPIVTDFIPDIVGAAVKQALSLVFSNDEGKASAFEARMDDISKKIETKIKASAKKLEPLANATCKRIQNMDKIEDSISARLINKEKINLLDSKTKTP